MLTIACDIADPLTAQRIVDDGSAKFGRIETLINNAGLFMSKPFTEYTPADYTAMIGVNRTGLFALTQR